MHNNLLIFNKFEYQPYISLSDKICVLVGNDVSEWFPVNVGLRQGCVMSPWLFDVYMEVWLER